MFPVAFVFAKMWMGLYYLAGVTEGEDSPWAMTPQILMLEIPVFFK
jgi:hypothetical protein